jgi:hypothetical protein
MECDGLEQLRFCSSPKTANIPLVMRSLIAIDIRILVLKPARELKTLDDVVLIVLVPVGEFPDLVESRFLIVDRRLCL